ncbi:flagellar basal body-associated FliL family protein [Thermodesulfatator atlanticus]|uniref:flagellar basal body-associated FliL family protein n=1 Tax=Thermodesulfatator atlanticus TaxID=501497 RepID=UPI0003B69E1E|nr:flagellar basal body-associated FliL family protein [Thermodesulfatator atlanticus]
MHRNYTLIAILIVLFLIGGLFVFGKQVKNFFLEPKKTKEIPSMLKALPFENKEKPIPKRNQLLLAKLKDNQIYLEKIIVSPKGAPRGAFVIFDLVIELKDKKIAKKLRTHDDLLRDEIVSTLAEKDWLDFQNADGLALIKKDLIATLRAKLGSHVARIYLIHFATGQQKGL